MATFQTPQFIEQEAKIIGFLTLPQFGYVAVGGIIIFASFKFFSFFLFLVIAVIVGGLAISLAFVKINGQSMPKVILSAFFYVWSPRTYTWQRAMAQTTLDVPDFQKIEEMRKNMSIQEKLQSMVLNVTTGKVFKFKPEKGQEGFQAVTFATGEKRMVKKIDY